MNQRVKYIKRHYEKVLEDAVSHKEEFVKIDKQLAAKLNKLAEVSKAIVDYIGKRSDGN